MTSLETHTLKEIVRSDFRAAAVFERYALDFCCNGGVTIAQACATRRLDAAPILAELTNLSHSPVPPDTRFTHWEADALIEHIVNVHHSYVRAAIPVLLAHTAKVARVHGERHPEVVSIAMQFTAVADELGHHMMKEERILFPHIHAMVQARREGRDLPPAPFGTTANPIRMMEAEHTAAGDALYGIRALSNGYAAPDDACTTYQVTYQELQQFETDLHTHVHLENNILFPRALALENGAALNTTHAS